MTKRAYLLFYYIFRNGEFQANFTNFRSKIIIDIKSVFVMQQYYLSGIYIDQAKNSLKQKFSSFVCLYVFNIHVHV